MDDAEMNISTLNGKIHKGIDKVLQFTNVDYKKRETPLKEIKERNKEFNKNTEDFARQLWTDIEIRTNRLLS